MIDNFSGFYTKFKTRQGDNTAVIQSWPNYLTLLITGDIIMTQRVLGCKLRAASLDLGLLDNRAVS